MSRRDLSIDLLLEVCEGCKFKAYKDIKGIITIGIGTAKVYPDGTPIGIDDTCDKEQAYDWLNEHLEKVVEPAVNKLCEGIDAPDKVYAALCSFAYNEGTNWFSHPSFTDPISNQDWGTFDDATITGTGLVNTFLKYDKVIIDGQRVFSKGLQHRRIIEIKYFLSS